MKELENINVVGKDSETIINHVFDCHEEIRRLKKEIEHLKDEVLDLYDEINGRNQDEKYY